MEKYKRRHGDNVLSRGAVGKQVRQKDGTFGLSTSKAYTHHQMHSVIRQKPELARTLTDYHPAIMRIDLPEQYIEAMTEGGDLVAEPFSGSGTTIIAAENLSRQCRAVEISPAYVAVALQRYVDAFNITPELIE